MVFQHAASPVLARDQMLAEERSIRELHVAAAADALQASLPEHVVIESKPDSQVDDLR
jgi:hypothetical protein